MLGQNPQGGVGDVGLEQFDVAQQFAVGGDVVHRAVRDLRTVAQRDGVQRGEVAVHRVIDCV